MKKILISIVLVLTLIIAGYFTAIYYVTYSEGYRAGELIKFSNKGLLFKTWEGELSQGVSEAQRFEFSVEDKEKQVISDLKDLQGKIMIPMHFGTYDLSNEPIGEPYRILEKEKSNHNIQFLDIGEEFLIQ